MEVAMFVVGCIFSVAALAIWTDHKQKMTQLMMEKQSSGAVESQHQIEELKQMVLDQAILIDNLRSTQNLTTIQQNSANINS